MKLIPLVLVVGGCVEITDDAGDVELGEVTVAVSSTTEIPPDATCTHIVVTRLSDFSAVDYRGPLAGAEFKAGKGDNHVTAVAYPEPCDGEPEEPPWIADQQVVTFAGGTNALHLVFRPNAKVVIDPEFEIEDAIAIDESTRTQIGRNGEDATSGYALDGWTVTQVSVAPAGTQGVTESPLFSLENNTVGLTMPRGLAVTPSGTFVLQVNETFQPLWVFDGAGNPAGTLPVVYPAHLRQWEFTDAIEALDDTHFVRTGWTYEDGGVGGLDLMERQSGPDGDYVVVTEQIAMPVELAGHYPLGVARVGSMFAVSTIPATPAASQDRLAVIDADGNLLAGPIPLEIAEGVFDASSGFVTRIGTISYTGAVRFFDLNLNARPAEDASLQVSMDLSNPNAIAFDATTGDYLVAAFGRIARVPASFDSATTVDIDLSAYSTFLAQDVRADTPTPQLLLVDVFGSVAPDFTNTLHVYDLATNQELGLPITFQMPPARVNSIAYIATTQQIATTGPVVVDDQVVRSRVHVFQLDGSPAYEFDLAPFGFRRVHSVSHDPVTDELVLLAHDLAGNERLIVTDRNGGPRRSFPTTGIAGVADVAPVASEAAAVIGQPSTLVKIAIP